jgi:glycerol-3-phosphate cytidylyltransferase
MSLILYTGGTFDLFHHGHFNFLSICKEITNGGKLVVALNTDEFVFKYKRIVPVDNYLKRQEKLLNSKLVDQVIENIGGQDSKPCILSVVPDFIAIGSDWATKNYYEQMNFTQEWLDNNNIGLIYIPYTRGISSTQLRKEYEEKN